MAMEKPFLLDCQGKRKPSLKLVLRLPSGKIVNLESSAKGAINITTTSTKSVLDSNKSVLDQRVTSKKTIFLPSCSKVLDRKLPNPVGDLLERRGIYQVSEERRRKRREAEELLNRKGPNRVTVPAPSGRFQPTEVVQKLPVPDEPESKKRKRSNVVEQPQAKKELPSSCKNSDDAADRGKSTQSHGVTSQRLPSLSIDALKRRYQVSGERRNKRKEAEELLNLKGPSRVTVPSLSGRLFQPKLVQKFPIPHDSESQSDRKKQRVA